ncbi:MAG: carbonic anhydrase [Bryobacterales bacterium]|nr:carbonic anhydrase [Bryobacterales bacterium]
MQRIFDGLARFQRDVYPEHKELFQNLAASQNPEVLIITCSDSRLVPSLMMQTLPGDAFVCRNAGNMIPAHDESSGGVMATIEYAVVVLGVRDIIVCGHSDCGAMTALLYPERLQDTPSVARWLQHGQRAVAVVRENYPDLPPDQMLNRMIEENVLAQIDHLKTHPCVAARLRAGKLAIHGWVYQIESGEVRVYNRRQDHFELLVLAQPV